MISQDWVITGRTDAEAETLILWPPDLKNWLIWKDPDVGEDWRREKKGMTEDEMVGWHHQLNGHESEWTLGVSDGHGGLACCDSWGRKESERLSDWSDLIWSDNSFAGVFISSVRLSPFSVFLCPSLPPFLSLSPSISGVAVAITRLVEMSYMLKISIFHFNMA